MCKVFKKQVSNFPSAKQSAERPNIRIKVVIITNLEQKQKSA